MSDTLYQFDNLYPWPNGVSEDKLNPFYNETSYYINIVMELYLDSADVNEIKSQ